MEVQVVQRLLQCRTTTHLYTPAAETVSFQMLSPGPMNSHMESSTESIPHVVKRLTLNLGLCGLEGMESVVYCSFYGPRMLGHVPGARCEPPSRRWSLPCACFGHVWQTWAEGEMGDGGEGGGKTWRQ